MQTALVCLCLCLLRTALSTPVPQPLPGRAIGNCMGQHRILLKGCNAKHGFYIFKYVYSFSTRRNQTAIKKEEADSQSTVPIHRLGEDDARWGPKEDGVSLEQGKNGSIDAMEDWTSLKPDNRSAPGIGRDVLSPRPGIGTRPRGVAGPTPSSSEGSGDLDLMVEADGDVSILPQGRRPSKAVTGNRSGVRSEDRDDAAPRGVPVEGATTAGRERAPATGEGAYEGSGAATVPGQGQEGVVRGTGTRGATLASVTKNLEDIQIDAQGVDEYTYIPNSGSNTVTNGKVGSIARGTSFTQISPYKDDKVNIFIERANIHVGEQETTQASTTLGSKDDGIPTLGTSSPLPRLSVTHDGNGDDNGIPDHRQPERPDTTATLIHDDHVTSRPRNDHPTGENKDGATKVGDREGLVAPGPWKDTGDDVTSAKGAGIHRSNDDEVKGEGQKFDRRSGYPSVTTPRQRGDREATVSANWAKTSPGTTMASPRMSEGDCTTSLGMAGSCKAGKSAGRGRGGSREVGPATAQPSGEMLPGAGARIQPGGVGLDKTSRVDKVPLPHRKASPGVLSGSQTRVGGHGGDVEDRPRATEVGGNPSPQAGQARGSVAVSKGQEQGGSEQRQGGEAQAAVAGTRVSHLPGHHGRRLGAGAPGAFAALGHSRQVDQVKHANELHVHERAFYALGGVGGGPRSPYNSLGSAESSQSSEGEQSSHSDSQQSGLRPAGWGASGHPYGRWSQGAL
ncbi:matrix extracellular phosphoglycoprotein [Colius striatus]|uniref:matrix extracellular phosphoglycoprotein n=1 Tax=Colius striatus TaxID=57412 RepID=UPI002B1D3CE6|nr:matrix extracellular phosphoglycoprotein [Colius striatus]